MELVDIDGKSLRKITGDEFIQKIISGERYLERILLEDVNLNQHPRFAEFNQYLKENTLGGNSLVLSQAYLKGVQAKGIYLPYLNGRYITLEDVDLEGAYLEGADLEEAQLSGIILRGANLREACLQQVFLNEADFSWAVLERADLTGASTRTSYSHTTLKERIDEMESSELDKTNFSLKERLSINAMRIHLRKQGYLDPSVDDYKRFLLKKRAHDEEVVESTLFEGENVSFARANLNRATLIGAYLKGVDFRGASLINAMIHDDSANIHRIDTDEESPPMMLEDADFRESDLTSAIMKGANAAKAKFSGANLTNTNISGVYAAGADFSNAEFNQTDLTFADLRNSDFMNARIVKNAWFGNADLRGAKNLDKCSGLIRNGRFSYTMVTQKEKWLLEEMLRKEGKRLMTTRWDVQK